MKVEVIGIGGIKFQVELSAEEREFIKEDFDSNLSDIQEQCAKQVTDRLLDGISKVL